MWVLIDNYDSFTYILRDYLLQTGHRCTVVYNDEADLDGLIALQPSRIIISPGPQTPLQAGISLKAIDYFHDKIPMLGICLGHQALGMFYGSELIHAPAPMHGKTSTITRSDHPVFKGLPAGFRVMRYHSLVLGEAPGNAYQPIAYSTDDSCIMASAHVLYPSVGIQFHPESVGTEHGLQIIRNWSEMYPD